MNELLFARTVRAGKSLLQWQAAPVWRYSVRHPFVYVHPQSGAEVTDLYASSVVEVDDHAVDVEVGSKTTLSVDVLVATRPVIGLSESDMQGHKAAVIACKFVSGTYALFQVLPRGAVPHSVMDVHANFVDCVDDITLAMILKQ